jgi:uncharacterized protein
MSIKKKALVTGASEGIGRAFARFLARESYEITAVARTEARLKELLTELGTGHRYIVADLSHESGISQVSAQLRNERYDLLVNNAGAGAHGAFDVTPLETARKLIRLNCESVVELSHAFLQSARTGDAIINLSSTLGFGGFPYSSVYAATKAFVLSFSESLWYEQKGRDVYVMALCPGPTSSLFHDTAGFSADARPPERIMQTPEQVVATALLALKRRQKPSVVSGLMNRVMTFASTRAMSRKRAISLMGGFGEPKKMRT